MTPKQHRVLLHTGGLDVDEFIDKTCDDLRKSMQARKTELWNGQVQFLCAQNANRVIPQVRHWTDVTHGQEHLEDVLTLLAPYPDQSAKFRSNFPHIKSMASHAGPRTRATMRKI